MVFSAFREVWKFFTMNFKLSFLFSTVPHELYSAFEGEPQCQAGQMSLAVVSSTPPSNLLLLINQELAIQLLTLTSISQREQATGFD